MVVEAHKALKKRRKRQKLSLSESQYSYKDTTTTSCKKSPLRSLPPAANEANIFSFLSKRQEGYSDLIKQLGKNNSNRNGSQSATSSATSPTTPGGHSVSFKETNVSKSTTTTTTVTDGNAGGGCGGGIGTAVTNSNGHTILNLERSPRQKRRYSFSDRVTVAFSKSKSYFLGQESGRLLSDMQSEADGEEEEEYDERRRRYDENQLDKEAGGGDHSSSRGLGGRARGMGTAMGTYCGGGGGGGIGIGGGRLSWDATDYKPMVFPNAPNITFIDEENLQGSLDDDDDTTANDPKANLAVMATDDDDNKNLDLDSQTDSESQEDDDDDDDDSESDGSVFTTDGSDHGHSYEKLVEEYSKEDNTS